MRAFEKRGLVREGCLTGVLGKPFAPSAVIKGVLVTRDGPSSEDGLQFDVRVRR